MIRKGLEKLNSRSGESIAETLVAILIAAFALLMLAGTINTASNLITDSSEKLDTYYTTNNNLDTGSGSSSTATVTVTDGTNTWISSSVNTYENSVIGSSPVKAYHLPSAG